MEEKIETPSVMSISLKYGAISGLISIFLSLVRIIGFQANPMERDWKMSLLSGVIGITIIVLAHREYKQTGDGFMSYGKGFGVGFLTTLFSFILSTIFLFVYLFVIDPAIYQEIWVKAEEQMRDQGQSEEAIEMGMKMGRIFMWVGIAFVGLLMSAILGAIVPIFTQKSNPEPNF
ncbi:MAG: DUF4199 domain-containing protein [Cyclobacteriaceae bacterium]|nr:MAG: DUF4199 domain-containing protein [Cyclobacteriaceae bacterium]